MGRGRWAPKEVAVTVTVDPETGRTRMIEVATVDVLSTIALRIAVEALYPFLWKTVSQTACGQNRP
jgi:hypothetical protein